MIQCALKIHDSSTPETVTSGDRASVGRVERSTRELATIRASEKDLAALIGRVAQGDHSALGCRGEPPARGVVDRGLFELHFNVGYHHHDPGRTAEARSAFVEALRHRPFSRRAWSLYLLNFLHPEWVGGLRKWKSSLSSFGRRRPGPAKAEKWIEQHLWPPERPQEREAAPPDIE